MPKVTNDQVTQAAQGHIKRTGVQSGVTWESMTPTQQKATVDEINHILEDFAVMVSPKVTPTPPSLTPTQRFHQRVKAGTVGK